MKLGQLMSTIFKTGIAPRRVATEKTCRFCQGDNHVLTVPYATLHDISPNRSKDVEEIVKHTCASCGGTGLGKDSLQPTYRECQGCKEGAKTREGIGLGNGMIQPSKCPTCNNTGMVTTEKTKMAPAKELTCPTCKGDVTSLKPIPHKKCTEGPGPAVPGKIVTNAGGIQNCPSCGGWKELPEKIKRRVSSTPILKTPCPHLSGEDTYSRPSKDSDDYIGPDDKDYFKEKKLIPVAALLRRPGFRNTFKVSKGQEDTEEWGELTPALARIPRDEPLSLKEAFTSEHIRPAAPTVKTAGFDINEIPEFKTPAKETKDIKFRPVAPPKETDERGMSTRYMTPEEVSEHEQKIKDTGYLKRFNSMRGELSRQFKKMTGIGKRGKPAEIEGGLHPAHRNYEQHLDEVSHNLSVAASIGKDVRGEDTRKEVKIPKTETLVRGNETFTKIVRDVKGNPVTIKKRIGEDKRPSGRIEDIAHLIPDENRLGVLDPMPYMEHKEAWKPTHPALGCNHDPNGKHIPEVGCIVESTNPRENPMPYTTTGTNARLVVRVDKVPQKNPVTNEVTTRHIAHTVGFRLKRKDEMGRLNKAEEPRPEWTYDGSGELKSMDTSSLTCIPRNLQREHYVVTSGKDYEHVPFPKKEGGTTERRVRVDKKVQLDNPFSTEKVEKMAGSYPAVKYLLDQERGSKFKPYPSTKQFGPEGGTEHADFDPDKLAAKGTSANPVEDAKEDTSRTNEKNKVQPMTQKVTPMAKGGQTPTPPTNSSVPDINPESQPSALNKM